MDKGGGGKEQHSDPGSLAQLLPKFKLLTGLPLGSKVPRGHFLSILQP